MASLIGEWSPKNPIILLILGPEMGIFSLNKIMNNLKTIQSIFAHKMSNDAARESTREILLESWLKYERGVQNPQNIPKGGFPAKMIIANGQ